MPKEVNPRIHVNDRDYPIRDHRCKDPEKRRLVKKLAVMITDNIPRKLPGFESTCAEDHRSSSVDRHSGAKQGQCGSSYPVPGPQMGGWIR